jgi:hypothetical protein
MKWGAMRVRVEQEGLFPAATTIPAPPSPCLKDRVELRQPYPVEDRSEIHDGARQRVRAEPRTLDARAAARDWDLICAIFHR